MRNRGLFHTLEEFQVVQTWIFFQVYGINLAFFLGGDLNKIQVSGPEIFLRFEADLDFRRPGFLEIKVQIKRPILRK